jgi:lycopene beta-cyclase
LVEFTIFSQHLLPKHEYDFEVKAYINKYLQLNDYNVIHEEFGIIPMTDRSFPINTGKHIIYIGTAGGQTKASTGYTFRRIQEHSQALVYALIQTQKPYLNRQSYNRFKLYDRMLLNIMLKKRYATKDIFTLLFQKNKPGTILKFLDEQTTFSEDLKIMSTTPYAPFLAALTDIVLHKKQVLS